MCLIGLRLPSSDEGLRLGPPSLVLRGLPASSVEEETGVYIQLYGSRSAEFAEVKRCALRLRHIPPWRRLCILCPIVGGLPLLPAVPARWIRSTVAASRMIREPRRSSGSVLRPLLVPPSSCRYITALTAAQGERLLPLFRSLRCGARGRPAYLPAILQRRLLAASSE